MAPKTGDVKFTTVAPLDYNYMLALRDNDKQWFVDQWVLLPPSRILAKIDMTILAAPEMTQADGAPIDTRDIDTVLNELRVLADEASLIILDGLDGRTYNVSLDRRATKTRAVKDESGTVTQYEIAISCWDKKPVA